MKENYVVYVKIKDAKHAEKVIKRLKLLGYNHYVGYTHVTLGMITTIAVYSDGEYQYCCYPIPFVSGKIIKPKELMDSKPIKEYLRNKHV